MFFSEIIFIFDMKFHKKRDLYYKYRYVTAIDGQKFTA